ncbi:branched-chain amino acid ABC transporter permease [Xanthobacter oligotrophicus]|uniref:branched-chain amino acid ABC transporter permease n=1 Tax=Xanthobacter oligotrophicus TaxID=2607286 RepID=UPI0011F1AAEE|nr:branched-chain amino acid ABC transporter permease [Xanthobacter oligotrophicus]MCG5236341.1 branched-chain amino acid ABC transporter permease [Xanthobacter oligotrophicus]
MLQALVDGLLLGGVYGVIATGLSLVFGVLGVVNFAHAEFLMLGMYVAWFAWRYLGLDPLIGSVLSFIVVFAVGYGVQRTLIQRVLKAPPAAQVFLTVGLMIVIENAALMAFGSDFRSVSVPYQVEGYRLGDIFIGAPYLYAFIAAVILAGALWLFLDRSWMGRAIRAVAQDPMAATLVGVDTRRTYGLAFGLGVALTAFGGAVILPYITVSPTIGGQFVVLMFTVVVLGGLGSVAGALAGGIMVGIVQSMSTLVFPIQLQNLCLFVIFIAVLALRPQGLIKGA